MAKYVLSLGSNCSDKIIQIRKAFDWLNTLSSTPVKASDIYETHALNGVDADYVNVVCVCSVDSDIDVFNQSLKLYEKGNGRTPESKITGVIPIDIDIVMVDGNVVRQKDYIQEYFQKGWNDIK